MKQLCPPLLNRVTCMDAIELMRLLPARSVDAIITDLPYGTTACAWDEIIPFAPMWAGVERVLKQGGVFVTTASQPFTSKLICSNSDMFRHEWIIEKSLPTGHLNVSKAPMKAHDNCVVFSDGAANYWPQFTIGRAYRATSGAAGGYVRDKKTANFSTINDGIRWPRSVLKFSYEVGYHPTQKPVALYEYLIATYTQPDELVLDFCSGSGTTGVAARNLKRDYILADTDAGYCEIARERLKTEFGSRKLGGDTDLSELPMFRGERLYKPAG